MQGMHGGHRERLRNRIRKYGFESLEEHEKLEYLLYAFVPRRDTNPIAHELLAAFGSFKAVLDAEPEQLASVKGMTENAALFLHTLPAAISSYFIADKKKRLDSPLSSAEYVIALIGGKAEEHCLILYLDDGCHVIKKEDVTSKKNRAVDVDRDVIVAEAVKCNAKFVILGHNHPNGSLKPSYFDIQATNRIVQALGVVNIVLADHLIVSGTEYYSMKINGDLVSPVDLNGSIYQFAEGLVRRENDLNRLQQVKSASEDK